MVILPRARRSPKCCPTAVFFLFFHARRHFKNANCRTFAGKSRPVEALSHLYRPRFRHQHEFSVDAYVTPIETTKPVNQAISRLLSYPEPVQYREKHSQR